MRIVSQIISILFHPMFMPLLGIFLIFQSGTHISYMPFEVKRIIYFVVAITSCILPLSALPLLYQLKIIKSFRMETARERFIPILLTAFFYYMGYLLLKKMGVPAMIEKFVLSTLIAIVCASAISYFWKISIHTTGIGGVTGAIIALSLLYGFDMSMWITLLLIASGITASARLYLGDHNPLQVYAGYFFGLGVVVGTILI